MTQYTRLLESNSIPRGSIAPTDPVDNTPSIGIDRIDNLCLPCKNKMIVKQQPVHTPFECLNQRCGLLESEVVRLKDRDIKSHLKIKALESKIITLEDAINGLTTPKQEQAAPYSFGSANKIRNQIKKSYSEDLPAQQPTVNYDHIIPAKRSGSRERVGLFGSLGASSQRTIKQ